MAICIMLLVNCNVGIVGSIFLCVSCNRNVLMLRLINRFSKIATSSELALSNSQFCVTIS
jgi:hypothetical protein